ncbi:7182_t:CDS:1, partial [Dentiscutata heterogama]
ASNQFSYAKGLLERAYIEMKTALKLLSLNKVSEKTASIQDNNNDDDDRFFDKLKTISRQALKLIELDEVTHYLTLDSIGLNDDLIKW